MHFMNEDKKLNYILIGFVTVALIIAFLVFGFGKNDEGHTGFQVIFHQGAWYITTMVFFALIGAGGLYFAYKIYDTTQEMGKSIIALIVGLVFFVIAFGKGCTDKANDGVTGPGGRPVSENIGK